MVTRRKRRLHTREKAPNLVVTENDEKIFYYLALYHYVAPALMAALTNREYDTVKDRLRNLMDKKYLTQYNPDWYELPINWPNFYTLHKAGVDYALDHGVIPAHYFQSKLLKKPSTNFAHDYQANSVVASIEAALPDGHSITHRQDIVLKADDGTLKVPYRFFHTLNNGSRKKYEGYFVNDQAFAITRPDGHTSYFGVEIETGHHPLERNDDLKANSVLKKMLMFHAAHKNSEHYKKFGIRKWRHIFVAATEEKMKNMIALAEKHIGETNLFLFTHIRMYAFTPKTFLAEYDFYRAGKPRIKLTESTKENASEEAL